MSTRRRRQGLLVGLVIVLGVATVAASGRAHGLLQLLLLLGGVALMAAAYGVGLLWSAPKDPANRSRPSL